MIRHSFSRTSLYCILLLSVFCATCQSAPAEDVKTAKQTYPIAVFPFQERGREVSEMGQQVTDLLFVNLVTEPELYLVEREDIAKLLEEQELNLSGMISPESSTRVGQLTGAKILVTGSVLEVSGRTYLVAKVIGTETSRVFGASVKGKAGQDLDILAEQLAEKIAVLIAEKSAEIVAAPRNDKDLIAELAAKIGDQPKPKVFISIDERHVGQSTIDPAAETEAIRIYKELGFVVIDPEHGEKADSDVLLLGEGFSEFAARTGGLQSVIARIELKAIDRKTGEVLAADRDVAIVVGLSEQIAGKQALQQASKDILLRILPKSIKPAK